MRKLPITNRFPGFRREKTRGLASAVIFSPARDSAIFLKYLNARFHQRSKRSLADEAIVILHACLHRK